MPFSELEKRELNASAKTILAWLIVIAIMLAAGIML